MESNQSYFRFTSEFSPMEHMVNISETDQPNYYLNTMWRVQWFLTFCAEHGIRGCIDDSHIELSGDAPNKFWIAVCEVYMDGIIVGRSTAAVPLMGSNGMVDPTAVQTAATFAKGRALSNAGFGTAGVLQSEPALLAQLQMEDGTPETKDMTPDMGFQPRRAYRPNDEDAAPMQEVQNRAAPMEKPSAHEPGISDPQSPVETPAVRRSPSANLTQEQARLVTVNSGEYAGKTMGEIVLLNPGYLKWVLSKPSFCSRYPMIAEAAQVLSETL